MPSIAAHMVCAKLVANELKINDPEFIKGNLLPDIIDTKNSHKKIKGKYYYIPDIDYFINTLNLRESLCLGYLSHLLLDKYYLENYIYDVVRGEEVFLSRIMYKEYDIINHKLLTTFNINIDYLNSILKNFKAPVDSQKYNSNIRSLNNVDTSNNLSYLNVEDFSKFLIETSKLIAEHLKGVEKDEYKLSLSNHCTRKSIKS